ncbi:MAG: hypothetical protein ACJAZS_000196 [Alteromonas naphthalenivorans]|jgi:hypothetical protein
MTKKIMLIVLCFLTVQLNAEESWGSIGNSFKSFGDSIAKVGKSVGSALGQMVGYVSSDYIFNFIVYNGVQTGIKVQTREYKKVMGGRFEGGIGTSMTMPLGTNTGTKFHKTKLYFSLEIPQCRGYNGDSYDETHYTLAAKNDKTVYVYHTYNDPDSGQPSAERIGAVTGTSKEFSGLIYNGAGGTASIAFDWAGKKVTVPVEAGTFNALRSTKSNPLRPSTLLLNGGSVALAKEGLGVTSSSGSGKDSTKSTSPSRYNYQITSAGGIETGLFPGNFRQPGIQKNIPNLRDITPFECQIWNQVATATEGTSWSLMPVEMPNQPLWFMYTGQAIANNGSLVDIPIGLVPEGKCVALMMLRPPVSQQLAKLYMVRINTTDEAVAKNFLTQLAHTKIPKYNIPIPSKKFIAQAQKTILTEKLPDNVGYLDNGKGLKGVITGMDIFASYGQASIGPFFYTVTAPQYAISSVQAVFMQFITNLTQGAQKELNQYIQRWVKAYPGNPEGVKRALETFLIKNGTKSMILKSGDKEYLSPSGYAMLNTVLYGPTSVSRMSVWYPMSQRTAITVPVTWADSKDIIIV